jgi:hypothetical protein
MVALIVVVRSLLGFVFIVHFLVAVSLAPARLRGNLECLSEVKLLEEGPKSNSFEVCTRRSRRRLSCLSRTWHHSLSSRSNGGISFCWLLQSLVFFQAPPVLRYCYLGNQERPRLYSISSALAGSNEFLQFRTFNSPVCWVSLPLTSLPTRTRRASIC